MAVLFPTQLMAKIQSLVLIPPRVVAMEATGSSTRYLLPLAPEVLAVVAVAAQARHRSSPERLELLARETRAVMVSRGMAPIKAQAVAVVPLRLEAMQLSLAPSQARVAQGYQPPF